MRRINSLGYSVKVFFWTDSLDYTLNILLFNLVFSMGRLLVYRVYLNMLSFKMCLYRSQFKK